MGESLMLRGSPFQTVGAKSLNDLLPHSVENRGTSRKIVSTVLVSRSQSTFAPS